MTAGPWAVARELGCAGGGELENWLLFLMGLAAPSSPFWNPARGQQTAVGHLPCVHHIKRGLGMGWFLWELAGGGRERISMQGHL